MTIRIIERKRSFCSTIASKPLPDICLLSELHRERASFIAQKGHILTQQLEGYLALKLNGFAWRRGKQEAEVDMDD